MKKDIHPQYYPNATVRCACGNRFTVGSTQPSLQVEVCSNCHPFYTGKDKMVDKMGQVQKFKARLAKQQTTSRKTKVQKARKKPVATRQLAGNRRARQNAKLSAGKKAANG